MLYLMTGLMGLCTIANLLIRRARYFLFFNVLITRSYNVYTHTRTQGDSKFIIRIMVPNGFLKL